MANVNCVFLLGRLTRDPELRYIPSGQPVCNFGMAVNKVWNDSEGNKKEEACFIELVVWGKQAESCSTYLKKGSEVFVEGHLQFRSWQTNDGQKRSKLEVVADRVQFMSKKEQEDSGEADDDVPFK